MNFGLESYEGLTREHFIFPAVNQILLPGNKAANRKIYIGMDKWGRKEWIGNLYPPKISEKEYLDFYAQHFNSIELNATHYKLYSTQSIQQWLAKVVGREFIFCPKMYQGVTHRGSLNGKEYVTKEFFNAVSEFGKHLGPVFLQVSESFAPKRKEELIGYLTSLPTGYKYFVEVRHPEWFSSKQAFSFLYDNLVKLNIGLIISDTPNRRDVVHMTLTVPEVFIRFSCFGDNELDAYRVQLWKDQLAQWFETGLQTAYFFMHIQQGKSAPAFAKQVQQQLNQLI